MAGLLSSTIQQNQNQLSSGNMSDLEQMNSRLSMAGANRPSQPTATSQAQALQNMTAAQAGGASDATLNDMATGIGKAARTAISQNSTSGSSPRPADPRPDAGQRVLSQNEWINQYVENNPLSDGQQEFTSRDYNNLQRRIAQDTTRLNELERSGNVPESSLNHLRQRLQSSQAELDQLMNTPLTRDQVLQMYNDYERYLFDLRNGQNPDPFVVNDPRYQEVINQVEARGAWEAQNWGNNDTPANRRAIQVAGASGGLSTSRGTGSAHDTQQRAQAINNGPSVGSSGMASNGVGGQGGILSGLREAEQLGDLSHLSSANLLNDYLAEDSALMQRARTQGLQSAASRGLLNSSMAAGAAQGAMIDRAAPLAMQDSQTLTGNRRFDVSAQNDFAQQANQLLGESRLSAQGYQQDRGLNQQTHGFNLERDSNRFSHESSMQGARLSHESSMLGTRLSAEQAMQAARFGHDMQMVDRQASIQTDRDRLLFEFETLNMDRAADIQAERDMRMSELDAEAARLQAELREAQAQNDFGRANELMQSEAAIQRTRDELMYTQQEERARNDLARELERMGYAFELDQRNVSRNFSASLAQQTLQNIQSIQADPNLDPEAKRNAVQNAMDMANQTLDWGAKFYATPVPPMEMPV